MKKWPLMLLGLVVLLSIPLAAQKKIEWLTIESDRFTGKFSILPNIEVLVNGIKEGDVNWKGANPSTNPIFYFTLECKDKSCSSPNFAFILMSRSENWKYLDFHDVHCLVDGKVVKLPESMHSGSVQDERVVETVLVPSDLTLSRQHEYFLSWAT